MGNGEETPGHKCLFIVKLQMEVEGLYFEPSEKEFTEALKEILERFQDCTLALPNFVSDPFFHSFTRYVCMSGCLLVHIYKSTIGKAMWRLQCLDAHNYC